MENWLSLSVLLVTIVDIWLLKAVIVTSITYVP